MLKSFWHDYTNELHESGPLRSRAAKAIGFIDMMIDYSSENAPLQKELSAGESSAFVNNLGCIWLSFIRFF